MEKRSPLSDIWPLYDLVVRTSRVELRYPSDEDFARLARLPDEGIHEPGRIPFHVAWSEQPSPMRERDSLKWWWSKQASWSVDDWSLPFAVVDNGEPVGAQDVRAQNFPVVRSVSTGSWLVRRAQGQGIGAEMRAAVLEFSFRGLGALEAHSAAFDWNEPSRRVSEKVGYEPNGEEAVLSAGGRVRTLRYRMSRAAWEDRRRDDIEIIGLERCLELFGLREDLEPIGGSEESPKK